MEKENTVSITIDLNKFKIVHMEKDPEKAFIITYYDYLFFTAWFLKDEATYKFLDLQIKHAFLSGIEHRKTVYIENWSEFHKILYEKVNE